MRQMNEITGQRNLGQYNVESYNYDEPHPGISNSQPDFNNSSYNSEAALDDDNDVLIESPPLSKISNYHHSTRTENPVHQSYSDANQDSEYVNRNPNRNNSFEKIKEKKDPSDTSKNESKNIFSESRNQKSSNENTENELTTEKSLDKENMIFDSSSDFIKAFILVKQTKDSNQKIRNDYIFLDIINKEETETNYDSFTELIGKHIEEAKKHKNFSVQKIYRGDFTQIHREEVIIYNMSNNFHLFMLSNYIYESNFKCIEKFCKLFFEFMNSYFSLLENKTWDLETAKEIFSELKSIVKDEQIDRGIAFVSYKVRKRIPKIKKNIKEEIKSRKEDAQIEREISETEIFEIWRKEVERRDGIHSEKESFLSFSNDSSYEDSFFQKHWKMILVVFLAVISMILLVAFIIFIQGYFFGKRSKPSVLPDFLKIKGLKRKLKSQSATGFVPFVEISKKEIAQGKNKKENLGQYYSNKKDKKLVTFSKSDVEKIKKKIRRLSIAKALRKRIKNIRKKRKLQRNLRIEDAKRKKKSIERELKMEQLDKKRKKEQYLKAISENLTEIKYIMDQRNLEIEFLDTMKKNK